MPRWFRTTLIVVTVLFGLLLLSMLIVPWQVKKQSRQWIAANTTRILTMEKVSFNPFTLKLELNGLQLTEQNSAAPFIAFDRLLLSLSGHSLLHRALILDRLELDNPFVHLELRDEQLYNFSDFIALADSGEPSAAAAEEQTRPFYFSLNNIVVSGGQITFNDRTSATGAQHRIRDLSLSVPAVGNIPFMVEDYVEPRLQLLFNDAAVAATGQLKPFHDSLETNLFVSLTDVDLPFYAYHSPLPLPVKVERGTVDFDIDLTYRISRSEQPQLFFGGMLLLHDLDLREPGGEDLLRWSLLVVDLDWANLFQRDFNLAALELYQPQLWIDRDASGLTNIERLMNSAVADAPEATPDDVEQTPQRALFKIGRTALVDGEVNFRDDSVAGPQREKLHAINLELTNLSNHPAQPGDIALTLQTARATELDVNGHLVIEPLSTRLDIALNHLPLQPYYPYLEPWLTMPPSGLVDLAGQFRYAENTDLRLDSLHLELHNLELPFGGEDHFNLEELSLSDGEVDLLERQIRLGQVRLSGGDLAITRLEDGSLSPLALFRAQPETAAPDGLRDAGVETAEEEPWVFALEQFQLDATRLAFTDATLPAQPQLLLHELALEAGNLHYPTARTSPFSFSVALGETGRVGITGDLVHTPLTLQAKTRVEAFPLADYNAFIPSQMHLALSDGRLDATVDLRLERPGDTLLGTFSGDLSIHQFGLRDPLASGNLLSWESLTIDGVTGEIEPFTLHIREVVLSEYLAALQITPEGQLNLTGFAADADAATVADSTVQTSPAAASSTAAEPGPPADIRIDTLTLQGGTLAFADRYLPRPFSMTMYDLGGRISGLHSAPDMRADVDLRGRLENHSPLTIDGAINPLSEELYLDLSIRFNDIDLTPLTPYSGTYLGYAIDKGKLYLDLSYQIEQGKISATNRVKFDQFALGDEVKSDKATALPIRLAIALLKDRNDEINLNIPVSGDLNDPDFSLAGTIFSVLRNLLVRAATSPFSLLTAMLGSDKDFSSIVFTPGTARLVEGELDKLHELAGVLLARPALDLEISGFADPDLDPEAYRQDQLQQLLIDARWRHLQRRGEAPEQREDVVIDEEHYTATLLEVYEQASFPRPRNVLGMLTKLPAEEMEKLLLTHIQAGEEQLEELARNRALRVREVLENASEEIKPRLFLKQSDILARPEEGPASRVELGINPRR
ncbi:MAG: DUF748 domain-containing protein [Pelovirga sp.]